MPRRPTRAARAAIGGWLAGSLVALLLAAQTLGLWHRAVHGPLTHAHEHVEHTRAASAFGHDADQTEQCRLFDQLTLADSLLAAAVALALEERPHASVEAVATPVARSAEALYEARAPPPSV